MNLIVNEKDNWELNGVLSTNEYNTTLTTAGSFVDRNIELHIRTPEGKATISNVTLTVDPEINYDSKKDNYKITVSNTVQLSPDVTPGWIEQGTSGNVTITGGIELNKSEMASSLITDESTNSGYIYYRTSASAGYNDNNLNSDIEVYQGEFK